MLSVSLLKQAFGMPIDPIARVMQATENQEF